MYLYVVITLNLAFSASTWAHDCRDLHPFWQSPEDHDPLSVSFKLVGNLIIVQAQIDGQPGNYIVDSGANTTIVNRKYYRKVGRKQTQQSFGFNGKIVHAATSHTRFAWGHLNWRWIEVNIIDLTSIERALGIPVHGLIGYDLLRNHEVSIDYQKRRILIKRAKQDKRQNQPELVMPKPDYILPMRINRHLPCIQVDAPGYTGWLAIDLGSAINILGTKVLGKIHYHQDDSEDLKLVGLGATRQATQIQIEDDLLLGGRLEVQNLPAVPGNFDQLNTLLAFDLNGALGYEFLSQYKVTLNYGTKEVYFWREFPRQERITEMPADSISTVPRYRTLSISHIPPIIY